MLRLGNRSGLLLPQVAAEHGWSVEDFWRALAHKSSLFSRAWCDPKACVEIFEAQIFPRRCLLPATG
jgi:AMMECR1 domain-containing protein